MATLNDNANAVSACATAIDAAIVAKGGTLVGGGKLRNAVAGIQSIPSGPSPTPYVELNGSQYFMSGINAVSGYRWKFKGFVAVNATIQNVLFGGGYNSNDKVAFRATGGTAASYNSYFCHYGFNSSPTLGIVKGSVFEVQFNESNGVLYVIGGSFSKPQSGTKTLSSNVEIAIGAFNENGMIKYPYIGRIFYIDCYNESTGEKVLSLKPRIENGVAGLYDEVAQVFHTSEGSEDFVYGEM